MVNSIIVYGPRRSGKTHNSEALRDMWGLKKIQDEWDGEAPVGPDTLVLTNLGPTQFSAPLNVGRVVSIERAKVLLKEGDHT